MTAPQSLAELQRWMLAAITQGGGTVAIDDVLLPSRQQSASERLAVYSHAYLARLLEVMRELFPCARNAVGDELFDQFAAGYLHAHPPRSYTLHRLADQFADYLEETRPADAAPWSGLVVDLARLEHAIDQVFDGPGPEHHVPPPGTLQLVPGFRLLAFRFPASTYFTAWKAGGEPDWPPAGEQWIALFRRDYVVRRHELSQVQFDLLSQLAAGASLDEALALVADRVTPAQVESWFTYWSAERFFST